MPIRFNHTIVFVHDKQRSADFLAEFLALPEPQEAGVFLAVTLDDGVTLDYAEPGIDFNSQHIAFLVSEDDFDGIFDRLRTRGVQYWADPRKARPGEINRNDGGRGSTLMTPAGTTSRSSPGPTAAAASAFNWMLIDASDGSSTM